MVEIRNCLNQPLLVNRGKAAPLHLLAHGRAVLDDNEAKSPHVRTLVASGAIKTSALKRGRAEGRDKVSDDATRDKKPAAARRPGDKDSASKTEE